MTEKVFRSISESTRTGLSWEEKWRGPDKGLITCWEVGRELQKRKPELAEKARSYELPVLGWKGGVEKQLKMNRKYGSLYYLAQWQGLRDEDLDIDTFEEVELQCSATGMTTVFTSDTAKYSID